MFDRSQSGSFSSVEDIALFLIACKPAGLAKTAKPSRQGQRRQMAAWRVSLIALSCLSLSGAANPR
jgi:hypothetical protein